ncbi:hypothetical protein L6452_02394 [Arctium lappa]|uniref:Uncharacterized protein n=1 Tax=Arctium lappa TaxID=4217 RepID=A0ACB9FIQ5_ARCLA|nr:hypothetical protein L6452_02394 [Arctium lappa]
MAAIEAAKRIKKNADANKSLSHGEKEENQLYEATMFKPLVAAGIDNEGDNNNIQRRGRKRKMSNQVFDSTNSLLKFDYAAVNQRRESYNNSLAKNESILATVFCSPKQLQPVNGGMNYRESLIKFSKDLGPTARKVANRMLLGQGMMIYQARHRLPMSDTHQHPCFLDVGSINGSVRNTKTNQVGQSLTSFGGSNNTYANYIADYKGKNIMVDDGKNNGNKWNIDNLEILLGKMKGGVRICNKGNGSSENQDFGHGQVGINGNLQKNIDMIVDEKQEVWNASEVSRRNGQYNSCVYYPSTYLQPSRMVSSSLLGLDGGVMNLIPVVPPPLDHRSPPVQPPQPPEINNTVDVNDGFCLLEEMQLALATYMQMKDQESNVLYQDSLHLGHDLGNNQPPPPPGI